MLRRVACSLVLGTVVGSLAGCGSLFNLEEREPWRAQAEAQCLASGEVRESAGIRIAQAIEGPGVCGVDHPFRVTALNANGAPAPVYAAMQPRAPQTVAPQPQPGEAPQPQYAPQPSGAPDGLLPPASVGDQTGALGDGAPMSYRAAPAPSAAVRIADGGPFAVSMDRSLVLSCSMIPALSRWLVQNVQPAAMANFGSPIVEMTTFGSYSCRRQNNGHFGRMSEHAFANAVDVRGFKLADGRETRILTGWRGSTQERGFWRDIAFGACGKFTTVLGPGAPLHDNHLHLDLARHGGRRGIICRPRAPEGWVAASQRGGAAAPPTEDYTGSIQDTPAGGYDE
ncbi:extensin-like domain-containing protein [Labrys neptuniae]